jgi:hypothetical protein
MYEPFPGDDVYWNTMYENLVQTYIAFPDGSLLRKSRGVASGDPWTSIVGSICNYIIIYSVLDPGFYKVYTFGDDSIIAYYPDGVPGVEADGADWLHRDLISLEELSAAVNQLYGVTVSVKKSYTASKLYISEREILQNDFTNSAQFLSLHFNESGYPVPRTADVLLKMMYPERNKHSTNWEKIRCVSYYIQGYWNTFIREHIIHYWARLCDLNPDPIYLSTRDYHELRHFGLLDTTFISGEFAKLPPDSKVVELYVNYFKGIYRRDDAWVHWNRDRLGASFYPPD